jgi:hypothetical protein
VRASDDDRQRVIDALQRHTAAGRLTLDEFAERAGTVFAAKTLQELTLATADLPTDPTAEDDRHAANARQLAIAFAVAVMVVVLLAIAYTLAT